MSRIGVEPPTERLEVQILLLPHFSVKLLLGLGLQTHWLNAHVMVVNFFSVYLLYPHGSSTSNSGGNCP